MAQTLRIGIIGAGQNTRDRHIPGLRAENGNAFRVELVGLCNRTRQSSERAAKALGIPRVFDHWTDLARDPDIDAVVIGTWPYLHAPATILALEHGKHVLCEARMAMDAAEAEAMFRAAQLRPHLVAQVVPAPFTLGVDRTVQRLLLEGVIGTPLAAQVEFGPEAYVDAQAPLSWRQDVGLSGMNVMMMGIWYESLMRWIGPASRVMAMGKVVVPLRKSPEGDRLEAVQIPDHLDVLTEMACGMQARMTFSAVAGHAARREIQLIGTEGALRFSDGHLFLARKGGTGFIQVEIPAEEAGAWRVEAEFIGAIRGVEPVRLTTFQDGLAYMRFTEAVHRSRREGRAAWVMPPASHQAFSAAS